MSVLGWATIMHMDKHGNIHLATAGFVVWLCSMLALCVVIALASGRR